MIQLTAYHAQNLRLAKAVVAAVIKKLGLTVAGGIRVDDQTEKVDKRQPRGKIRGGGAALNPGGGRRRLL